MSLDPNQFRALVVVPVLNRLGLHSPAAEELVLGTAAQESGLRFLKQLGGGPALGLYQCEPATHADIWRNFLHYKPELRYLVSHFATNGTSGHPNQDELVWNLAYATAICRVHYLRVNKPLPVADDLEGLAAYWKKNYNTTEGKGTPEEFIANYRRLILAA